MPRRARAPRFNTVAKSSLRRTRAAAGNIRLPPQVLPVTHSDERGHDGDARRRLLGRRGCAYAAENRGSWHDGGCWAGRCACSRLFSTLNKGVLACMPSTRLAARQWTTSRSYRPQGFDEAAGKGRLSRSQLWITPWLSTGPVDNFPHDTGSMGPGHARIPHSIQQNARSERVRRSYPHRTRTRLCACG